MVEGSGTRVLPGGFQVGREAVLDVLVFREEPQVDDGQPARYGRAARFGAAQAEAGVRTGVKVFGHRRMMGQGQ